jgi:hypothetical protein
VFFGKNIKKSEKNGVLRQKKRTLSDSLLFCGKEDLNPQLLRSNFGVSGPPSCADGSVHAAFSPIAPAMSRGIGARPSEVQVLNPM